MAHQRDAVRDMRLRDRAGASGHFLVMDTGYGKTLTSLAYLRLLLDDTEAEVDSVLWVCPTELVRPTLAQLRDRWGAPAVELPRGGVPGRVNCVRHDALRTV
eukprot:gene27545-28905_t